MRSEKTVEEIDAIAEEIQAIARMVQGVSRRMRERNIPTLLIHGSATTRTYLPYVYEWASKLESDFDIQSRALSRGLTSGTQREVTRYQRRSGKAVQ